MRGPVGVSTRSTTTLSVRSPTRALHLSGRLRQQFPVAVGNFLVLVSNGSGAGTPFLAAGGGASMAVSYTAHVARMPTVQKWTTAAVGIVGGERCRYRPPYLRAMVTSWVPRVAAR
jgi:hypothetical protein